MSPTAAPTLVLDVWGRRVVATGPADAVAALLTTAFGFQGPRDTLAPFCAWTAARMGYAIDPTLDDDAAATALIDLLLASGEATTPPLATVTTLRP